MEAPSPSRFRARRNAAVFLVETDQDQEEEAEAAAAAAAAATSSGSAAGAPEGGDWPGSRRALESRRPSRRGRNGYSYQFGWMNNKKFIKQLQKDNIDLAILQSEIGSVNTKRRKKSWKERLLYAIRSNVAQIILCAFVLIDAVIVIAEIILEIKAITSEKQELEQAFIKTASFVNRTFAPSLAERGLLLPEFSRELVQSPQFTERLATSMNSVVLTLGKNASLSCNITTTIPVTAATGRLRRAAVTAAATATAGGGTSVGRNRTSSTATFDSFRREYSHAKVLHDVSAVLHFVSIGILGLFVLEVALKVVCLGRNFVREKFEIVDAVVIIISFVADIAFVKLESTEVSVMVLFLLWRIVRVINGLMMHEKQRGEFRIQLQKRARRMSEMKCDSLETERDLQEKHILFLEELCRELGGNEEQITNCKPRYVNITKRQSSNALKSMAAMSAGIFGGIAGAQHRRSLSVITNNLGTPPTTSRQSSALDTIAEGADASDLAETLATTALSPSSQGKQKPPSALINGRLPTAKTAAPADAAGSSDPEEEDAAAQHRQQGKRNSILQRQFYVEDDQDGEGSSATASAAAAAVTVATPADDDDSNDASAGAKVADADDSPDTAAAGAGRYGGAEPVRLQDVRVDSGQYTTTGSDSEEGEEDPWELQEKVVGTPAVCQSHCSSTGGLRDNYLTEYLATT